MASQNSALLSAETPVKAMRYSTRRTEQSIPPNEDVPSSSRGSGGSPNSPASPMLSNKVFDSSPMGFGAHLPMSPNTPPGDYFGRTEDADDHFDASPVPKNVDQYQRSFITRPKGGRLAEKDQVAVDSADKIRSSSGSGSLKAAQLIVVNSTEMPKVPILPEELSSVNQSHALGMFGQDESFYFEAGQTSTRVEAIDNSSNGDDQDFAKGDRPKRQRKDVATPAVASEEFPLRGAISETVGETRVENSTFPDIYSSLKNQASEHPGPTSSFRKPIFTNFCTEQLTLSDIKELLLEDLKYNTAKAKRGSRTVAVSNATQLPFIEPKLKEFGYIYIYKALGEPGYVKIGVTKFPRNKRLDQWSRKCVLTVTPIHDPDDRPLPHYKFVEKLIHHELVNSRRRFQCWKCKSQAKYQEYTRHQEWFEVSDGAAVDAVQKWRNWMIDCKPYDSDGKLTAYWAGRYNFLVDNFRDVDWDEWRKPPTNEQQAVVLEDVVMLGTGDFARELDDICEKSLNIGTRVVARRLTVVEVLLILAVVSLIGFQTSFLIGVSLFLFMVRKRPESIFKMLQAS